MEVNYKIVYIKKALKGKKYWKMSGNKAAQRKISDLITSIKRTPYEGIGNLNN